MALFHLASLKAHDLILVRKMTNHKRYIEGGEKRERYWTVCCKLGRAVSRQNKATSSDLLPTLFTGTLSKL